MSTGIPKVKLTDHSIGKEDCLSAVRNALHTSDFILENYEVETFSNTLIGFMARHLRLTAHVKVDGRLEVLSFFCKSPPASEGHRSFVLDLGYFQKEIVMYEKLAPIMSKALPPSMDLPLPRCHLTRGNKDAGSAEGELIVMEDVTLRGYRVHDKAIPFDLPHCRQVMRSLARFHAPSLVLQSERGKCSVEDLFLLAKETLIVRKKGHMGYKWITNSMQTMLIATAGMWPERFGSKEAKAEMLKCLQESWKLVFNLVRPSEKYANVLCHGDTWANNVLFKYGRGRNSEEEVPEDALLVDLQLVRFVPPALDLLLFFHTSTTREFRDRHLKDLIAEYHGYVEAIVTEEVLNTCMPLKSLLQSMEEFCVFGKAISTAYLPFILNDEDTAPMMDDSDGKGEPPDFIELIQEDHGAVVLRNAEASQMYRRRVADAFQEYLEYVGLWK